MNLACWQAPHLVRECVSDLLAFPFVCCSHVTSGDSSKRRARWQAQINLKIKDSQHMPTLVSPQNVVWGIATETWHVTSQVWVVFLIGWSKFPSGPYQSAALPRSEYCGIINMEFLQSFLGCYFAGKLGGASKCWLFSHTSLRKGLLCWHITNTQGTKETGCIKYL